jgi:hypothetical protein
MSVAVDDKYYQVIKAESMSERLLIHARANIYADFISRMSPSASDTILDVGVSDVINDGANVLEREYPHQQQITACGLSEAEAFQKAFPKCRYQKIVANDPLPFDALSFDIATANAVLEHVGSFENQAFFMKELCRVAKKVFISVPHRYFPIEHHTSLPFVHYNEKIFHLACNIAGKQEWAEEANLILMTRKRLWQLARSINRNTAVGYTGLRMGPFSSNIFIQFT